MNANKHAQHWTMAEGSLSVTETAHNPTPPKPSAEPQTPEKRPQTREEMLEAFRNYRI